MNIRRIGHHLALLLLTVPGCYTFGQTWIQTSAPETGWNSLACSADGRRIVAASCCSADIDYQGFLYISTNAGTSWTICNSPSTNYTSVAMSADGMTLIASTFQGILFASRNGGDDWTTIVSPGSGLYNIACSADGSTWVCGSLYGFLISRDAGLNWTFNTNQVLIGPVACSANGSRLVACENGAILTSTDYGATWLPTWLPSPQNGALRLIAGSADLAHLISSVTVPIPGSFDLSCSVVFTSHDFGYSWQQTSSPCLRGGIFAALTSSAQGKDLAALVQSSSTPVLTSTDGGATWSPNAVSGAENWGAGSFIRPLASSADGKRLVLAGFNAGIYTWHTTPRPELKTKTENSSLVIFWLVPSTKFMLQQSPDMGTSGWTDVTTSPSFDSATLEYQFRPKGGGTMFYRLALAQP
jgi:photosystem II stability/assembly factor-like uncharacterized protein